MTQVERVPDTAVLLGVSESEVVTLLGNDIARICETDPVKRRCQARRWAAAWLPIELQAGLGQVVDGGIRLAAASLGDVHASLAAVGLDVVHSDSIVEKIVAAGCTAAQAATETLQAIDLLEAAQGVSAHDAGMNWFVAEEGARSPHTVGARRRVRDLAVGEIGHVFRTALRGDAGGRMLIDADAWLVQPLDDDVSVQWTGDRFVVRGLATATDAYGVDDTHDSRAWISAVVEEASDADAPF